MFYFIRHGETDSTRRDTGVYRGYGTNLMGLTAEGVRQIRETAGDERLRGAAVILSSPYTRALQSAAILSRALDADLIVEPDLREWVANKAFIYEDAATAEAAYLEFQRYGGDYPPEGERPWESAASIRERVFRVLDKYADCGKVAVVCHGMLMQAVTGCVHPRNGEIIEFHRKEN